MSPTFLIIGAQKSGTSALFDSLTQHPQVAAPYRKEVHYFDHASRGDEVWYRGFFPEEHQNQAGSITGEATPYYLFHPHVPRRAFTVLPNAKLLVLLRNPVDRAFSHYNHSVRKGYETRSFDDAIREELEQIPREVERMLADESYSSPLHRHRSYVTRGYYLEQLERWCSYYPRNQMLVLKSEHLLSDPASVYARVTYFLGIDSSFVPEVAIINRHAYRSTLSEHTRNFLVELYAPHNAALARWLGEDLKWN